MFILTKCSLLYPEQPHHIQLQAGREVQGEGSRGLAGGACATNHSQHQLDPVLKISLTFAVGHIFKEITFTCDLSAWSFQELLASQLARLSLVMVRFGQPASSYYMVKSRQSSLTSSPASSLAVLCRSQPPCHYIVIFCQIPRS